MSSFEGKLVHGNGNHNILYEAISLDRFDGDNLKSSLYWLSHAHCDHMKGLESHELTKHLISNPGVKIYCTDITKKLLRHMKGYQHLHRHLVTLLINEPTLVLIPVNDQSQGVCITLTAMSAGHCPGSAMLLIEGADGTVLYTGDFRLDKGAASLLPALHDSFGGVKKVDHLYCDTTFLTRKTMNIVSRAECEEEIVEQVKSHISRGNNYHVVLKTKAKLGYENVYRILYERFRMKTHVRAEDAEVYSGIPEINEIVTLDNRTQVHTCWRSVQGGGLQDKNAAGLVSHGGCDTLNRPGVEVKVIHLSTMWFALTENKHTSVKVDSDTVRCCYSFHSSYSEIEDFIRYINPCYAYPNVLPMDATMEQTQHLLNSFLSKRADDASPELCQTNSWKSVHEIDSWWIAEKRSTNNTGFSSPKKPKLENEDNGSEQSTPTGSREATPELSLWSDSSDLENETPADAD